MILVDTSVWIDHFHARDITLEAILHRNEAATHVTVIEELAMGSLRKRDETLRLLSNLLHLPVMVHHEFLTFVNVHKLFSRGLSAADTHLLGSVMLSAGAKLWTKDKRLNRAAEELGVAVHF